MSYSEFARDALRHLELLVPHAQNHAEREALAAMRRELSMDMSAMWPRLSLSYAVEITACLPRLIELAAPEVLVEHTKETLAELPALLAQVEPKGPHRFFDAVPTAEHRVGGLVLRHPRYAWSSAEPPDEQQSTLDVTEAWLALIERDESLRAQAMSLLEATVPGWGSVLHVLTGGWSPWNVAGPVTIGTLREFRRAEPRFWRGARETSFLLGRVAHLLGAPPESESPAVLVAVELDGFPFEACGWDRSGMGMPTLDLFTTRGPIEERHVRALEEVLFGDTKVADVYADGIDEGSGVAFALGARDGRLFAEGLAGTLPFRVAR